jgi:hypothetical protein
MKCSKCDGTGNDLAHLWPDGTPAACEACDGYGEVEQPDPPPPTARTLTEDQWAAEFRPVNNPADDTQLFDTYGDDLAFVQARLKTAPLTVWTWLEGDEGECIVSGFYLVNRIGYFITEVPFPENVFITVEVEMTDGQRELAAEDPRLAESQANCEMP